MVTASVRCRGRWVRTDHVPSTALAMYSVTYATPMTSASVRAKSTTQGPPRDRGARMAATTPAASTTSAAMCSPESCRIDALPATVRHVTGVDGACTVPPMSVLVATRADITLDAVRRVAWEGEGVELAPEAITLMDRSHVSFAAFVRARVAEDPGALIYGT